ncbi:dihydroorotate oxidase [Candidatus Woesebacteria bacterium]|nr:dihydroorotate oxidase [Candidatus Woesebacteria bacterium]
MKYTPFYDPLKSYDENYNDGPFGQLADKEVFEDKGEPSHDFLGHTVYTPFGIPAGPVINSNYVKGAFDKGFDIVVYKTVRSDTYPCHPFPNVLSVDLEGNLTLERAKEPLIANSNYKDPISITNSFGVPSKEASVWQEDVKKALSYAKKGQVLVLSFMGTVKEGQSEKEFIEDFVLAARQAKETGAPILEVNLSCPNIGNEGLVCYNLSATRKILAAIRQEIGEIPLIVKTGYFEDMEKLKEFASIVNEFAQAVAAINTIAAPVIDDKGNQALPGNPVRLRSGICGASIKWANLEMVQKLAELRKEHSYDYKIIGVGGITVANDYSEVMKAGADAAMSATGAMWNPYLALDIKEVPHPSGSESQS